MGNRELSQRDQLTFELSAKRGRLRRLYPLTEGPTAVSKALLPIGDGVMIDRVLEWIEVSGIIGVWLLEALTLGRSPNELCLLRRPAAMSESSS
jgi:hypothetical protein